MNDMKNTLRKPLDGSSTLVYQMFGTDAVCNKTEELPTAYSVLMLLTEEGEVMDSGVLYDVARNGKDCIEVMNAMLERGTLPSEAKRAAEMFL